MTTAKKPSYSPVILFAGTLFVSATLMFALQPMFGKLILQRPNILIMDEPTNHLDMESIEALNLALENYPGTLIFVSHDREFVSSVATRIIDMEQDKITDFSGSYEEYLRSQGIYEVVKPG